MSELTDLYHANLLNDVKTVVELEEIKRGAAQGAVRVVREAEAEFKRAEKNLIKARKESERMTDEANRCQATIDALDLSATKKYRKNNHAFRNYKTRQVKLNTKETLDVDGKGNIVMVDNSDAT